MAGVSLTRADSWLMMGFARTKVTQAVYCLQCGGPADTESLAKKTCGYCRAPLVPLDHPDPRTSLPCRRCATAIPASSHYCGHCGHPAGSEGQVESTALQCPGCGHQGMYSWNLGEGQQHAKISVCSGCGGSFASHQVFNALIEREQERFEQRRGPGELRLENVKRFVLPQSSSIQYKGCPVCNERMHRKNYGRLSGVVVDQCAKHGVFFDAGELPQILEFVSTGGLAVASQKRDRERKQEAKRAQYYQGSGEANPSFYMENRGSLQTFNNGPALELLGIVIRVLTRLLGVFFR